MSSYAVLNYCLGFAAVCVGGLIVSEITLRVMAWKAERK